MSAAVLNLAVEQNATFDGRLTLTDAATGKPSSIAGVVARMAVVQMYGRPALISLDSNGNGLVVTDSSDHVTVPSTVEITLTAAQTSALVVAPSATVFPPKSNYYYDLILEYPGGVVTRLVQGTLTVSAGATGD